MRRIVRGAALVGACTITMAGCGGDRPPEESPAARLTAAVLSVQDMPPDFLPAQDQRVFGRLKPADRDCRRLLRLADLRGLRDVPIPPQAHAVFYRTSPGSTLAEHLLALGPGGAQRHIEEARQAAAGCPQMRIGRGDGKVRLHRTPLAVPGFEDNAYGLRYTRRLSPRYSIHFDMVMAQQGARLLVVEQPALIDRRHRTKGDSTRLIAAVALRKLVTATSVQSPVPLGGPATRGS
ncbi:MAG: hypothetical protein QOE54_731 [Streptosporangiaceae bacterium]|nr:hypothetical protein [Streptosporangiaceae bacterium]